MPRYFCEACLEYLLSLPIPSYRQHYRTRNLRVLACSSGGEHSLMGGEKTGLVTRASYYSLGVQYAKGD